MHVDCKIYCKTCNICQSRISTRKNISGKLGTIIAEKRCELVGQSDKEKKFTAKVCIAFYTVFAIKKLQTFRWHPQANGLIASMLAKIAVKNQVNWLKYLQTITMEYNATQHRITGETPHFLMYGT